MPENKRQHFVPQFYLRFFSSNNNKRKISLFHIPFKRSIQNASLKDQSYKDNLYGVDKSVEYGFQFLESHSARIISEIISNERAPHFQSELYLILILFITTLYGRTIYAIEARRESIDTFSKILMNWDTRAKDFVDQIKLDFKNVAQELVELSASTFHLLLDLDCKLLINETKTPFMTSDHPVVFYNQYFETCCPSIDNIGLISKGLQIFFPLTPRYQLILFDKDIYKINGIYRKSIILKNQNDINNLNALQLLNAHSSIYFNDEITSSYIEFLCSDYLNYRRIGKACVKDFYLGDKSKGKQKLFIQFSVKEIRCKLFFYLLLK